MRTATSVSRELQLNGTESLSPVSGRQMELLGEFTVTTGTCGFNLLTDELGSGLHHVSVPITIAHGNDSITVPITFDVIIK